MAGSYGGYHNCAPYQTQFSNVDVTPGAIRNGRSQPSSELMTDANKLTQGMYKGLDSCSNLMKGSQSASVNARELGRSFEDFSTDFGSFAATATKFLTSITYPDFKVVTHPKPTFNEVGVWGSMNEDFNRQMESFSVLGNETTNRNQNTNQYRCSPQMTCNNQNPPRPCPPQPQRPQQGSCWPNHQNGQHSNGQCHPYHPVAPLRAYNIIASPPMYYPYC